MECRFETAGLQPRAVAPPSPGFFILVPAVFRELRDGSPFDGQRGALLAFHRTDIISCRLLKSAVHGVTNSFRSMCWL